MPATPRIIVYPADMGRCGHRLIWPAQALAAQGADVRVVTSEDAQEDQLQAEWHTDALTGVRTLVDVEDVDADVVVFQRPLQRTLAESIPKLQAKGVRVVVEVDDDFTAMSRRNVSWRAVQPTLTRVRRRDGTVVEFGGPDRNWHHVAEACRLADLVTVTTPALAHRYGRHGRVAIVPNHIPASYLDVRPELHEGVYVGWTGSVATHPDDLQVTRGAVGRAVAATGALFAVVGTGKGVQQRLDLAVPPLACGWVSLDEYPKAVAQFDVGIVPLELTAFNEAKSALKGLEFAALGVPFIASPTDPYIDLPVGQVYDKPKNWERWLRRYATDPDLRAAAAAEGCQWAATQTIEGNCEQWLDAWRLVNTACV